MDREFFRMQKLAGLIIENQSKQLDEAEKTIQAFGPRLMDGLKKDGFDAKFTTNDLEHMKLQNIVKAAEDKKLAVVYYLPQGKYISITTNKNNQDAAFKVVNGGFVQNLLPDGFKVSKSGAFFVQIQGPLNEIQGDFDDTPSPDGKFDPMDYADDPGYSSDKVTFLASAFNHIWNMGKGNNKIDFEDMAKSTIEDLENRF